MTDNEKRFRQKVEKLTKVYVAKNKDYGDSFTRSLDKRGIVASIVRMEDKMNRIDSLHDKPTTEVDESLVDSLEDLANYAIMTAMWLESQANDIRKHVKHWDDDLDEYDYDDLFDDDIEQELDWNDGWHEFDDDDFDDDEPEDDPDDFSMDGLPKFRIVRRPRGTISNKDFWDMIKDIYEQEGNHVFDTDYLDMIRYLYDEEGD